MNQLQEYIVFGAGIVGLMGWILRSTRAEHMGSSNQAEQTVHDHVIDQPYREPGSRLLPILNPVHNIREMTKQALMLEDHLFQKQKRCSQCIKKHFLTIEGLAEEAVQLDEKREYTELLTDLPEKVRKLEQLFISSENHALVGQELRKLRKEWVSESFEKF